MQAHTHLTLKYNNMSGGHFDYKQYHIDDIVSKIEYLIKTNDYTDGWGYKRAYSEETITKFKEALTTLRRGAIMAQRIDWLVSGDDGEESFHQRWEEELNLIK
jgi:hypothetical protein